MGSSEIVELESELSTEKSMKSHHNVQPRQKFSVEDDINKLFESIEIKNSHKKAMKRPIRVSSSQASGIGISESVSLKQAFRGLCISQASEMAAMRRLSKHSRLSSVSNSGKIKRLYEDGEFFQISLIPENATSSLSAKLPESQHEFMNSKKLAVVDENSLTSYDVPTQNAKSHSSCFSSKSSTTKHRFKKYISSKGKVDEDSNNKGADNNMGLSTSQNFQESRKFGVEKGDEKSRSREKGEFSQSSKSSIGEFSSSTSFSDESNLTGSIRISSTRPHMSKSLNWEAIRCIQKQYGNLGLRHFKLLKKVGGGDIGTVYLAELSGSNCFFALKIMDNEFLAARKKIVRAQTEREILEMLDHPFLPTLYSHFTTDKLLCLVMEYCPGGDLHVLRQTQPNKKFSEQAARFYVAEVLLALEYLHMFGVIYRDLKPENVLVHEDGHIMLTDFDLSLRSLVNPTLVKFTSSPNQVNPEPKPSCIDPFCIQPTWLKSDPAAPVSPLPELVAEPTSARSNSFVGTHEYLAPEIIKGEGHGNSVDWWMFGIFLYELLFGKTPFKGTSNEETLSNSVCMCLEFPPNPMVSPHARDLIGRLLNKFPENRLGAVKGAIEIKQHPFFEGLNWALIRREIPPEIPKIVGFDGSLKSEKDNLVFEMF